MSNNLTRKPSISASSLGEVRKIYMSKMTEQGCSRTLKEKCRDIWHEVINDAIDAEAECSMRGIAIVHEKKQEPAYIQNKENGKKDSSEGDTESETETEESNSETEVEIDPSLDGSECECASGCACACACCRVEYPESLVESGGSEAESLLSCGLDGGEGDDE
ncbi:hypothetical protein AnigIFM60653_008171 [Aspergillus niger]|nr:hypothetical protein AnigIFM60653_008171 [Aspergillus niger]